MIYKLIIDKLNRLNNGINKIDIDYLKSLPSNIGEILNNLFKKLEIWYYEGALNDFSIEEQVKILLLINNNINNFKYDKHRQRGAVSPHKG